MGSWGFSTFDDDIALEVLEEWVASTASVDELSHALNTALSGKDLEEEDGHVVCVLSAIVEHLFLHEKNDDMQKLLSGFSLADAWLSTIDKSELRKLVPKLLVGLDRIVEAGSEIATREDDWKIHVKERQQRLNEFFCPKDRAKA